MEAIIVTHFVFQAVSPAFIVALKRYAGELHATLQWYAAGEQGRCEALLQWVPPTHRITVQQTYCCAVDRDCWGIDIPQEFGGGVVIVHNLPRDPRQLVDRDSDFPSVGVVTSTPTAKEWAAGKRQRDRTWLEGLTPDERAYMAFPRP